ncbi:MAG: hypothetical protein L6246_03335 [Thermodesulfovibrionales bacterium]|nr:hypothetical protein [Nitrospinota bacterium]MCG2709341.1 hypothetical protein [Thermodesulfovibrionales bacterium]
MNKIQKTVLIAGAIIMIVVFIFAPLYMPYEGGYFRVESTHERGRKLPSDVFMRELLVIAITAVLYFALKDKDKKG